MRYDVLLECDDHPHPRHFCTIYAANDDEARRLATERLLREDPELRLQIVRADGDRLVTVAPRKEWHPAASGGFCNGVWAVVPGSRCAAPGAKVPTSACARVASTTGARLPHEPARTSMASLGRL
jgi:hypothetical protein